MLINIKGSEVLQRNLKVGDLVTEKGFKDCIGLVVEGRSGGFNVLMLKDKKEEQLFINHEKDLDQLWLNENYSLVATSDSVEINVEYLK